MTSQLCRLSVSVSFQLCTVIKAVANLSLATALVTVQSGRARVFMRSDFLRKRFVFCQFHLFPPGLIEIGFDLILFSDVFT